MPNIHIAACMSNCCTEEKSTLQKKFADHITQFIHPSQRGSNLRPSSSCHTAKGACPHLTQLGGIVWPKVLGGILWTLTEYSLASHMEAVCVRVCVGVEGVCVCVGGGGLLCPLGWQPLRQHSGGTQLLTVNDSAGRLWQRCSSAWGVDVFISQP